MFPILLAALASSGGAAATAGVATAAAGGATAALGATAAVGATTAASGAIASTAATTAAAGSTAGSATAGLGGLIEGTSLEAGLQVGEGLVQMAGDGMSAVGNMFTGAESTPLAAGETSGMDKVMEGGKKLLDNKMSKSKKAPPSSTGNTPQLSNNSNPVSPIYSNGQGKSRMQMDSARPEVQMRSFGDYMQDEFIKMR